MRNIFPLFTLALGSAAGLFASVDTDLLALVPSGTKMVGSVDLQRTRSTAIGQQILAHLLTENGELGTFVKETNFDPRRDLDAVLFSSNTVAGGDHSNFAVLARGKFDEQSLASAAKAKGGTTQTMLGLQLIIPNPKETRPVALAFPAKDIALFSDLQTMRQILAERSAPSVLDQKLQREIDSIGAKTDIWFASTETPRAFTTPDPKLTGDRRAVPAQVLQSITESSGGFRFGDLVDVVFDATARSNKDAISLSDAIRFAASMLQMQRDKEAFADVLASALDGMSLKTNGDRVSMAFSVPEKGVEQLLDAQPKHTPHSKQ